MIPNEKRNLRCNNVHQCEHSQLRLEPIIYELSEQIIINVEGDNNNHICSNSQEENKEENDQELNGNEAL